MLNHKHGLMLFLTSPPVSCVMALSGLTLDGFGSHRMEQQEVEDEFTCAGVLRGALLALKPSVEQVFGVKLSIGGEDGTSAQSGQIWLQLRGTAGDVQAAKVLYIPRLSVSVYLK